MCECVDVWYVCVCVCVRVILGKMDIRVSVCTYHSYVCAHVSVREYATSFHKGEWLNRERSIYVSIYEDE